MSTHRLRRQDYMILSVPFLRSFTHAVKDDEKRELINEVLQAFQETVVPALDNLPKGLIHGDCNEFNIIVAENAGQENKKPEDRQYHICGIIDFGHMRRSCYVFEVAIAIAYAIIGSNIMDPLEAGAHVLAGYLTEMELSDVEWEVLKECVAGRFAQTLVMGAYNHLQDPGNAYVLATAANGWPRLKLLLNTPKSELYSSWKDIVDGPQKQ